jgi:DnaJ family protein C protein 19
MIWLILGAVAIFLLMGGMRAFERASVTSIKSLAVWVAALAGLSLTVLLFLTGRGGIALGGLILFGPLLWEKWRAAHPRVGTQAGPRPGPRQGSRRAQAARPGWMSVDEAYQVLGLHPGASEADIREAHRRLMRAAHPDSGGSDWLAARINQARDVLLRG